MGWQFGKSSVFGILRIKSFGGDLIRKGVEKIWKIGLKMGFVCEIDTD